MKLKLLDGRYIDVVPHAAPAGQVMAEVDHSATRLLQRAEYLDQDDRLLVHCALRLGYSQRKIAELVGMPFGTVCRRLKRLQTLLTEPHITQLLDSPDSLEPADRQIAIGYFLRRQTLRQLAKEHGLSTAQVGRRVEYFKGWLKGANSVR